MKIPKEEYRKAKGCLKRYNYNCLNILMIRNDTIGLTGNNLDGMPHSNQINDIVANTVIQLDQNKSLQQSIKEYKAVQLAVSKLDEDSKLIFEHLYNKKDMSKWEIINEILYKSEDTFNRKHCNLVHAVYQEIKEK